MHSSFVIGLFAFLSFSFADSADAAKACKPFCPDPGYNVSAVVAQATRLANHSWEFGTASEALLELYNPELAVFDPKSLRDGQLPRVPPVDNVPSLAYAKKWIRLDNETLIDGDGKPHASLR